MWARAPPTPPIESACRLDDQTAEFIPFKVTSTAILTYFHLLLDTNVRILVSVINTHFPPDAPRRCTRKEQRFIIFQLSL